MNNPSSANQRETTTRPTRLWILGGALIVALLTIAIYWPGLSGSWLFDDYPNIVDNHALQPKQLSIGSIINAVLSSPSSEFKRPLASLSFVLNFIAGGLDPFGMKLTNLVIHLLNGGLLFWFCSLLLRATRPQAAVGSVAPRAIDDYRWPALLITAGWLLLPINLTAVLYVVQRMESLANLGVLAGLVGYTSIRLRMQLARRRRDPLLCLLAILLPMVLGLLAKETAVLLPLYAFLVEWIVFRGLGHAAQVNMAARRDPRIFVLFGLILALPLVIGAAWLLPQVLSPLAWSTRDFTLTTRLLSEARIVVDYVGWTLLPIPSALSFYHDEYLISSDWLHPWTTLPSLLILALLLLAVLLWRRRRPLMALGIALFLGAQTLTATVLPLELVYEHRNYFASAGLLLAVIPGLWNAVIATASANGLASNVATTGVDGRLWRNGAALILAGLLSYWAGLTAVTAYAWGDPLRLARELAVRAPQSPRAQYELGRTYIMYSHYEAGSPYTQLAYAPLERAAAMPESSILPQQALIFMNSRMGLPLKPQWWASMIAKLAARPPGVQDESSLIALEQCRLDAHCQFPVELLSQAFRTALDHPLPKARLLSAYADYSWGVTGDQQQALRLAKAASDTAPGEPVYRIKLINLLIDDGQLDEARAQLQRLKAQNLAGTLDLDIQKIGSRLEQAARD